MGTINPLGDSLDEYYQNLIAGKSGIRRWESLDMSGVECKIGGDLGFYDTSASLARFEQDMGPDWYKRTKKMFRSATFSNRTAVLTSLMAYKHAGLLGVEVDPMRTSVVVAGHNLNSNYIHRNGLAFMKDPDLLEPLAGVEGIDPNIPATISEVLGVQGASFTIGGACASGNLAIREGFRDIVLGESDRVVVTGALFDVSPPDIQASVIINAVVVKPEYQNNPEAASRPFDIDRCGFVYSHGAGTLILESLESALDRGATIYGEVLGVKASANANHLPLPGAEKQTLIMRALLEETGIAPEQVDYANCHATGTPSGDLQEIRAIKGAFGKHAYRMKINAPKSMLGHTCWASPIVETIGGLLQMEHGKLHPTINIRQIDPEIDMDICANNAVDYEVNYMLKNSFGFGGINCCTLIGRYGI